MHVYPIQMRWGYGDNYCYVVADEKTKQGTIIDPAAPDEVLPVVLNLQSSNKLKLTSIINTHHHYDHSDGNVVFHEMYPELPIIAGKDSKLVTKTPANGETFALSDSVDITAIHTPCHTQDSICWFIEDKSTGEQAVFTGDTLFNCGCGRFFEGDANQMHASLSELSKLPAKTKVYPGHEYTKSNVKFAVTVDPKNQELLKLQEYCETNTNTCGVFTIADETAYNPFLRTDNKALQAHLGTSSGVSTMAKLRAMKDKF